MHRCARAAAAALAASLIAAAAPPAAAQSAPRAFPATALRGKAIFGQPPELLVNGIPRRLAPGARIRAGNNAIVLSGTLAGQTITVHYTTDPEGLLMDVWLLTVDELSNTPWPTTPEQSRSWTFDPIAQTWSRW